MKLNRRGVGPAILAGAILLSGCSDFATEPDRLPASLALTPEVVEMTEGETADFTVQVMDADGVPFDPVPAWAQPHWTASDPSRLSFDEDGTATAVGPGEAEAIVQIAGLETRAVVRTNPIEVGVGASIYLTQATQRVDGGVPIVANRDALLRIFVTADRPNFFDPQVRATAYLDGAPVQTEVLDAELISIPLTLDESSLSYSYDLRLPGSAVRDGLGLVIEIDPAGAVPATSSSALRIPATGELPIDVTAVPPFRLTIVPVRLEPSGLQARVTDANLSTFTRFTRDVFPLDVVDVVLHETYTTEANMGSEGGWSQLLNEIAELRTAEGSSRYYYGAVQLPSNSPYGGLGYVGYPASIGSDASETTLAHELGHNFSLLHAPCGGPGGVDPNYPHSSATLGTYGYELSASRLKDAEDYRDLMSYCTPRWISDYHYEKTLDFRDEWDWAAASAAAAPIEEALVISGGIRDGRVELRPALTIETRPSVPRTGGSYRVEGVDAGGAVLFSVPVEPRPVDHDERAFHFVLAVPTRVARPDQLEALRLSGPAGQVERVRSARPAGTRAEVTLRAAAGRARGALEATWRSDRFPLAVVRDASTGQILSMSRSGRVEVPGRTADEVEVLLSDGVRTERARVRQP